jgi:peptidoglycan hydrolase CwlO-like protein
MAKKKVVDAEEALEGMKNKKFGLSIQNIVAIVTFLSTVIAGWYSFTGRIDSLEAVVDGFAEASDIELVTSKLEGYDEDIKYLRDKLDNLKTPKVKSYDGDIIKLENKIDKLNGEIKRLEKLLKDPLADFK